jgi:hypothetical protein
MPMRSGLRSRDAASLILAGAVSGMLFTTAGATSIERDDPPELSAVLRAARTYVHDYEAKLTFILADESYTQQIRDQVPITSAVESRTMKSWPRTLIHDLNQQPVSSTGEIVVEAETGRVRRTELKATIGSVSLDLTTDYALEKDLDLWVPTLLRERYEEGIRGSGADSRVKGTGYEEIWCEAKYSHFRRFEVKGGIKGGFMPLPRP